MGIFDRLTQQAQPQGQQQRKITPDEMRTEIGRIQNNPGAYLQQRGFNIPGGMTDPKEITQYLLKTGQVGNNRLQQVMQFLGRR